MVESPYFGRKKSMIIGFTSSFICTFASYHFDSSIQVFLIFVGLIKFCSNFVFNLLFPYSAEVKFI